MSTATSVNPSICRIEVFPPGVQAAFSLKDSSRPGRHTMRRHPRMTVSDPIATTNMRHYADTLGFPVGSLVLPKKWPHGDRIFIVSDDSSFDIDPRTGTLNPIIASPGLPEAENSCDGFITQSPDYVLGVQGADCPMLFLYDPVARIVGAIHCGWRPVARRIVSIAIRMFTQLGANPANIRAYIGPGAGDDVYTFCDSHEPSAEAEAIFGEKNRLSDLQAHLRPAADGQGFTLALNALVEADLLASGLTRDYITNDPRSCIMDPCLPSYRRDQPNHTLSLGSIRLV